MKYNLFKIWLLLAFLSFGAVPVSMMAQPNTQYEVSGLATSNSIIVEYTDDIDIVYNDNGARWLSWGMGGSIHYNALCKRNCLAFGWRCARRI